MREKRERGLGRLFCLSAREKGLGDDVNNSLLHNSLWLRHSCWLRERSIGKVGSRISSTPGLCTGTRVAAGREPLLTGGQYMFKQIKSFETYLVNANLVEHMLALDQLARPLLLPQSRTDR